MKNYWLSMAAVASQIILLPQLKHLAAPQSASPRPFVKRSHVPTPRPTRSQRAESNDNQDQGPSATGVAVKKPRARRLSRLCDALHRPMSAAEHREMDQRMYHTIASIAAN